MNASIEWAALACCLLAVGTAGFRLTDSIRGTAARITGTLVWSAVLVVCYSFALSAARALAWPAMLALSVAGAGAAGRLIARRRRARPHIAAVGEILNAPVADQLLLAAIAAILGGLGALCVSTILYAPEIGGDNLGYHLPRLGYWLQSRSVAPFLANNPRIGTFPPNANILELLPVLFLRSDRWCGFAQLLGCYATGLAIYGTARRLSAPRPSAALAALVWFAIPSVLLQCTASQIDLITAFFVTAAVYFLVVELTEPSAAASATSAAAAAFAVGAKTQTLPFALLAWAILAARHVREKRRASPAAVAALAIAIVVLTSAFPILNYILLGHPSGSAALPILLLEPGLSSLARNAELIFSPLMFWRWSHGGPLDPTTPYVGATDAALSEGLGLLWTTSAAAAVPYALWRAARAANAPRLAAIGLPLLALVATLYMARHQPSVVRFALPAVAPLSVALAVLHGDLASSRRRWLALSIGAAVVAVASAVCFVDARQMLAWRAKFGRLPPWVEPPAPSATGPYSPVDARYGDDLASIAGEVRRLPTGARIGLLTRHYAYEGLAFGDRYGVIPIPLSYDPPDSVGAIERLDLDAVWVNDLTVQLFRIGPIEATPDRQGEDQRRWTGAKFRDYDDAFMRVHNRVTFWRDLKPLLRALLDPSSGWGLAASANGGMLFRKGYPPLESARILNVLDPNGVESIGGRRFLPIGARETLVRIYAPRAERVALVGDYSLGPPGPHAADRKLRLTVDGRPGAALVAVYAGVHEIPLDLDPGFNVLRVTALDEPQANSSNGDRRPPFLGVADLSLRSLASPASPDETSGP